MPPVVRDTLSLRPSGFYAYTFLAARAAQVAALAVTTGLAGNLLFVASRGGQEPAATVIVVILFTSAALTWTLFSWTGYSRRYLPYMATWAADAVFLVPFVAITIALGLPMADAQCASVSANGKFEITAPPGSQIGKITFARDGRAACTKLFAAWVLLIVVCAGFAVSALAVGFLDLGERQLRKAIFAVREEPQGSGAGVPYVQGTSDFRGRGFAPTPAPPSRVDWSAPAARNGAPEMDQYGDPRPSFADDQLNLNRPITLAPPRMGPRMGGGGGRYEETLGQPAAARMPRLRPEDGAGGGFGRATPSQERYDASVQPTVAGPYGKRPAVPSTNGLLRSNANAIRGNDGNGRTPVASMPSNSASFDEAPTKNPVESPKRGLWKAPGTIPLDSGDLRKPHESLVPKPLSLGRGGKSTTDKGEGQSTESGWWGALAGVINRPEAEYDPNNVV
ncbi:hypothetical protein C8A05DRAFT_41331 [Staphylotrichum tortipilum]|uniref:MARVEL domain-containing protein n=1 Tax=Staphylotrichum tortipilum TaxID=2831512 RepID=A0AAN6MRW3_9PEZI|nr:hypothetical protein C8A05DRAFT_41331 [Staphylotrichum longicolle]